MVVKEKLGKRRYILFKIESSREIHTGELISALVHFTNKRNIDRRKAKPWLIDLTDKNQEESFGILRCTHWYQKELTELLNSIKRVRHKKVKIETITCSGTIKKVRKRLELMTR